jgi:hypothetical protein
LFLLVSFAARDAGAQAPSATDSSRAQVALARNEGRRVRLATRTNGKLEGRVHLDGKTAQLSTDERSLEIPVADIDSMWVQRGSFAGTIGTLAAIPCALIGALAGAGLASDTEGVRKEQPVGGALVGGAIGGVACGLAGAGLGYLFKRWDLEYIGT